MVELHIFWPVTMVSLSQSALSRKENIAHVVTVARPIPHPQNGRIAENVFERVFEFETVCGKGRIGIWSAVAGRIEMTYPTRPCQGCERSIRTKKRAKATPVSCFIALSSGTEQYVILKEKTRNKNPKAAALEKRTGPSLFG